MPSRNPLPAKLTRPNAAGLLLRERLLDRLDQGRSGRAVWISSPAGSGKTSLVTSWIATRKLGCTWYQVDRGDADPATVVHYVGLAARAAATRKRVELPHLTPELMPILGTFLLRFFEGYFARFREPHVLVLDNFQDAPRDSAFPSVVAGALQALPQDCVLVCISRDVPPPQLARWAADDGLLNLEWDDLKLTDDEARGLASLANAPPGTDAEHLNDLARGWTAGFKLLLRSAKSTREPRANGQTPDAVFDLLATEVFDGVPAERQEFLLRTAFLPRISAAGAERISGQTDAAQTLASMFRNRFFVERRSGGAEHYYEYHPLFTDFLRQRAQAQYDPAELTALRRSASAILEDEGHVDAAMAESIAAEDWPTVCRILLQHAPAMAAQGRTVSLESWLVALPPTVVDANPWLLLWLGVCRALRDPHEGQALLGRAYRGFQAAGDTTGTFVALGNLVGNPMFAFADGKAFDSWIAEFERVIDANQGSIPEAVEAQVLGACQGILIADPGHPILERVVARARQLVVTATDAGQRYTLGALCACFLAWRGDVAGGLRFCKELRAGTQGPSPPWPEVHFGVWTALLSAINVQLDEARAVVAATAARARATGMEIMLPNLYVQQIFAEISAGDYAAAHAVLDLGCPELTPQTAVDVQGYRVLRAAVLALEGKLAEAAAITQLVKDNWVEGGPSAAAIAFMRSALAYDLFLVGRHTEACEELAPLRSLGQRISSDLLLWITGIGLAWSNFQLGNERQGLEYLREAMSIGAKYDYRGSMAVWIPHVMADLMARAIEHDIEADFARRLIRARHLRPPADRPDLDQWPWPIRIYTFGRFSILQEENPLHFTARSPKKPFELLKCLVALGGRGVSLGQLLAALWPDLDGPAANNAFKVALHRLRRSLGDEQAIAMQDGTVSLDSQRVWADVWAFQRLAGRAGGTDDPARERSAPARALDLYRGLFLAGDDAPWAVGLRDRLRSQFVRSGAAYGAQLEAQQRFAEAVDWYRRLTEREAMAEECHRGLIRSLVAQGRDAEALDAYHRCRGLLRAELGIDPSPVTRALVDKLDG